MQHMNNRCPKKRHSKADMEHWDTVMTENLGKDQSYNQPLKLLEEIHTGRLQIRQAHRQALPVKQHPEYHLAVKLFQERERQRAAEGDLKREESKDEHATDPVSSSSHWEEWWSSLWWDKTSWK